MNNCYSSLGSINGNPKKQNCGDGRCDPPDRGINPDPKQRGLFSQIYRQEPSNQTKLGEFAGSIYKANNLPELRNKSYSWLPTQFNQGELMRAAQSVYGFEEPGRFTAGGGDAPPIDTDDSTAIEKMRAFIAQYNSDVTEGRVLSYRESMNLVRGGLIGGEVARQSSLFRKDVLSFPFFDLYNGGLTFQPSSAYNVNGGGIFRVRGTVSKLTHFQSSLSITQSIEGWTYFESEGKFTIDDTVISAPVANYNETTRVKWVIIPYVEWNQTWLIGNRASFVLAAGAEAYSYKGLYSATADLSLTFNLWDSCSKRKNGNDPNFSIGIFGRWNRSLDGVSSSLYGGGGAGVEELSRGDSDGRGGVFNPPSIRSTSNVNQSLVVRFEFFMNF